ncbi:hypothetical protein JOM56_010238 [Amanita muscaria]
MTEEFSRVTQSPMLVEPRSQPLKRADVISYKRRRSIPKETPPPVPPIPGQYFPWLLPPSPVSFAGHRYRLAFPATVSETMSYADEGSWSSAFDISSYEHLSLAPSPASISPAPSSSAQVIYPSTAN